MKLDVQDIVFDYESVPVLDGVTLEIDAGEMLGIIGPNGSGKSTFLQCINHILEPIEGRVFVDGNDLHAAGRDHIAKTVGYVPQQETSTFPATVFDAILMGRKPYISWQPTEDDRQRVATIIEILGLSDLALRDVNELSGGQRQKVLIGRALAQEAEVFLLDEPTASLDVKHQLEVMNVIRMQVNRGLTAVLALHDLNLAARFCDDLALLHDGRIFAAGPPDAILTSENLRTVYDVEVSVIEHDGRLLVIPEQSVDGDIDDPVPIESDTAETSGN